jgi:hypothetical protein
MAAKLQDRLHPSSSAKLAHIIRLCLAAKASAYHQILRHSAYVDYQPVDHVQGQALAYNNPKNLRTILIWRQRVVCACQPLEHYMQGYTHTRNNVLLGAQKIAD